MAHERVVELLRSHRIRIARALARQVRATVPRYKQVESVALERNFATLLIGVERYLATNDDRQLLDTTESVAQMRAAAGFQVADFVVASLGFLPVLRRFILEKAPSLDEGINDYEAVEAIALPLVGRVATVFLDVGEDTMPNARVLEKMRHALSSRDYSSPFGRVAIERVTGDESEEETVTSARPA